MIILWGPNLVQVYNDGYRALMGKKHPRGLGQPTRECWPEVWQINKPIYARVGRGRVGNLHGPAFSDHAQWLPGAGVLHSVLQPLRDDMGQVADVLVTAK